SPQVRLLNPNGKTETLWQEAQVREKTGVGPAQIVDWLSLIGDSVDNIAGVPGVGPRTGVDLLQQYQSVDGIYAHLDQVKSEKLRFSLGSAEGAVRRNQKLIRLKDDLPCEFSPEDFARKAGDSERLRELYARWGFKTLVASLDREPETQSHLLLAQS